MTIDLARSPFVRWRTAIFAIFAASGLSIATWASRVPSIKADLGIENSDIGLLLLGMGVASILGLSASSVVIARFGTRTGMLGAMIVFAGGVALIGIGTNLVPSIALVLIGLVLFGFGNGSVDVMMNVDGAAIETQSSKTLLPLFHAFFSVGTVLGAGLGALAATLRIDVFTHTAIVAVVILVVAFVAHANVPTHLGADAPQTDPDTPREGWRARLALALSAWREPRTYALGVVMLGMAFAEGGANDWLALGVSEDHGGGQALGAAALMVFSVAMTVVRVLGGPLVDRFGRVGVLRVLAVTATAGILLFILAPNLPLVFVGAALWGMGASLGFPLGMSAAADDPAKAAARVSAAATIGYVAFLCGPPVLGFISDRIGLLNTLFVVVALVAASGFASSSARPPAGAAVGAGRTGEHG
ncbi:MFS transporter [Microbacterium sp. zg.Y1090]|uniref:MFS transporter n=1 Tax=Microbacterium TaxID=33882 RepID=UPI00214C28AC|nr:MULTISPECIES: MFS transporter [unclassified Microbacterium]MCR2813055.1 MFS transporter [Microbacterium sp. zg.Y1084]MCR2819369.1 MFS transporter [Microbacterium sp. zg.Y1090]MDL5487286.1 MFS transporter [Microbacterium sp. zg-Y1211]WIM28349.1 MFS transporter [Microbacterium sp. zg-Y1090]